MDIDTYRYLMSSLIQVFGALIAVDVIFLVLRYQDYQSRLSTITYELGSVVVMLEHFQKVLEGHEREKRFATIDPEANVFKSTDAKDRLARICRAQQEAETRVTEAKTRVSELRETTEIRQKIYLQEQSEIQIRSLAEFVRHNRIYNALLMRMDNTRSLIPKMMGLPAGLVLAFSLSLIPAERLKAMGFLLSASLIVVAVSGIALYLLVRWAYLSFKEE